MAHKKRSKANRRWANFKSRCEIVFFAKSFPPKFIFYRLSLLISLGLTPFLCSAVDFNAEVRPILSNNCFFCHGPDAHERKADLRLDTEKGATRDLGGYAALVPGSLEKSEMWSRIMNSDLDEVMPPLESHKKLEPGERQIIRQWIVEGAKYDKYWAYEQPRKSPVPDQGKGWSDHWIDRFVFGKLREKGMSPSPDADRSTLARRLHFDLTGLPPRTVEMERFVEDKRPLGEVVADRVDTLLARPEYGERLATYWLDLVRFASTVGYHGDQDHPAAPYRNWVIDSFNQDLPLDRFTREQLAGDLLEKPTDEQLVATGYNRLLQTSHEGGIQRKEYLAIYAADRVRNVSAVWMGATVGCAQCHDHKYDPYTIDDFYQMSAFFGDIHDDGFTGNSLPTVRPPYLKVYPSGARNSMDLLGKEISTLLEKSGQGEELKAWAAKLDGLTGEINKERNKGKKTTLQKEFALIKKDGVEGIAASVLTSYLDKLKRIQDFQRLGQNTMITKGKSPREIRILPRGNWLDDSGPVVLPAVPGFMGAWEPRKPGRSDRLDLANWLTDSREGSGGLTARVFANRLWYLFFGEGLSPSLDDFGGQGQPPSNRPLLDNLALALIEDDWSVKKTIRQIVISRAYRQSSLVSPELAKLDLENKWFGRQARYRLSAEMIRDNALFVSGLLQQGDSFNSAKPYQPAGYYRHLNFPGRRYKHDSDKNQWRRGVYLHWQRQFLHPMMKAMDAPSREECTAKRPRSNTPNAALALLNDPTFVEAARAFATRIIKEERGAPEERVQFAWRTVLSREARPDEVALLIGLLKESEREYADHPEEAKKLLGVGLAPLDSSIDPSELASWTMVSRAILNLGEATIRN
jgi:hypothetical protein